MVFNVHQNNVIRIEVRKSHASTTANHQFQVIPSAQTLVFGYTTHPGTQHFATTQAPFLRALPGCYLLALPLFNEKWGNVHVLPIF